MSKTSFKISITYLITNLGHIVFNVAIGLSKGFGMFSVVFILMYLLAAVIQVKTTVL